MKSIYEMNRELPRYSSKFKHPDETHIKTDIDEALLGTRIASHYSKYPNQLGGLLAMRLERGEHPMYSLIMTATYDLQRLSFITSSGGIMKVIEKYTNFTGSDKKRYSSFLLGNGQITNTLFEMEEKYDFWEIECFSPKGIMTEGEYRSKKGGRYKWMKITIKSNLLLLNGVVSEDEAKQYLFDVLSGADGGLFETEWREERDRTFHAFRHKIEKTDVRNGYVKHEMTSEMGMLNPNDVKNRNDKTDETPTTPQSSGDRQYIDSIDSGDTAFEKIDSMPNETKEQKKTQGKEKLSATTKDFVRTQLIEISKSLQSKKVLKEKTIINTRDMQDTIQGFFEWGVTVAFAVESYMNHYKSKSNKDFAKRLSVFLQDAEAIINNEASAVTKPQNTSPRDRAV